MKRSAKIVLAALTSVVSALILGWIAAFAIAFWLHSMMMNDSVRQLWQRRIDRAEPYFIDAVLVTSLLLFGLWWRLAKGFRGGAHI